MGEYTNPVKEFIVICEIGDTSYYHRVLAINADWALTIVNKETDWDFVSVRKFSDKVVALASFGARNVSNEKPEQYLHYHCTPVNSETEKA